MVAVTDEDCLGKEFTEGEVRLEVSKNFYGDHHADYGEVLSALKEATIANIVGNESVALAVENGFVDPNDILFVQGVPHAQMVICA
jgi:hypothetical protein